MIAEYFRPGINYSSFSDRFSSTWTFGLLLLLSMITAIRQYAGPNAVCWTPAEFLDQYNTYAEHICWASTRYKLYFAIHGNVETRVTILAGERFESDKLKSSRTLYQWLPLILAFQGMFFKLPDITVKSLDRVAGFGCQRVAGMVKAYSETSSADKKSLAKDLAEYFNDIFCNRPVTGIPFGMITLIVAFGKLLFFANAVTQLSLMERYLSPPNVTSYGQYVLKSVISSNYRPIAFSPAFPSKITCDLGIFHLNKPRMFTIQCQLPINEFYDQVYFFVWIWLLVVCVASGTSGAVFLVKSLLPIIRNRYVIKYLRMSRLHATEQQVSGFTSSVIGQDGVFILELIGDLSSDVLVRDIVINIWHIHHDQTASVQHTGIPETQSSAFHTMHQIGRPASGHNMDTGGMYAAGQNTQPNQEMIPLVQKEVQG